MAEPLLKRTFSRLRGKERFRRKTDPKLGDISVKNVLSQSSSSPADNETSQHVPSEDSSRPGTNITVAKKQNWAKLSSPSCQPLSTEALHCMGSRAQDWESNSGKAQVSKQLWSQRTLTEDIPENKCRDSEREPGHHNLTDLTRPAGSCTEVCISSSCVKLSGHGAYLQSLDRSSRAWVLATGKAQTAEEPGHILSCSIMERRPGPDGEKNIWYNPIPEEEDSRRASRIVYGDPWRKRETKGSPESKRETHIRTQRWHGTQCIVASSSQDADGPSREFTAESTITIRKESLATHTDMPQALGSGAGSSCSNNSGSGSLPSDSPGAQKKGGGSGGGANSMMDRIKSPGTVRRLSMKMRKLPELRRKLSLRSSRTQRQHQAGGCQGSSPPNGRKEASSSVITKYHLDSSAPARPLRRSSRGRSSSKGGYLSDGDSPELLPKQTSPPSSQQVGAGDGVQDLTSFRPYCLSDQPRCAQRLSGLLTVHLLGAEELFRSPKADAGKEVFCAIQVDGETRARTSLLTCRGPSLPLNHTFNLELERARLLKMVILSPQPSSANAPPPGGPPAPARNRVCCLGVVAIPSLFKGSRSQQLCVKLEPRGLLYLKLTLQEKWETPPPRPSDLQPPSVFGVELCHLVEKEGSAITVPLLIQKCVAEIEKRGLKVVGLYRLCGSAAVKKELRDAFERDSAAVILTEDLYPDINVITGILKDYLRELPSPLITSTLYEVVLKAMSLRLLHVSHYSRDVDKQWSQSTVSLLECLPEPEKATLTLLLDHLSLVASYSDSNRMTCQNLAVCFGPVLLTPSQESWRPEPPGGHNVGGAPRGGRSYAHSEEIASAVDFKRHIEVLHYLLQQWPVPTGRRSAELTAITSAFSAASASQDSLQQRGPGLPLKLDLPQEVVVSRRGRGRLESPPCNRYAGDWSICGRDFLSSSEADYDEVAGTDSEEEEERERTRGSQKRNKWEPPRPLYDSDFPVEPDALDLEAPFTCRLSLKDFDTLISDLERELAKQINICL